MALAYLLSKTSAKPLNLNPNIPTLMVLSIIPDMDILINKEGFHRGPIHSVITALLIFIPFFLIYRKKAIPYFLALISHTLIGDLTIGGNLQLLWPITTNTFSLSPPLPLIEINSTINLTLELALFTTATIIMFKLKDLHHFLHKQTTSLLLTIPMATVLLPTLTGYPLNVPFALIFPHLFYLSLFGISVLVLIFGLLRQKS
jgi:hypothetical protein